MTKKEELSITLLHSCYFTFIFSQTEIHQVVRNSMFIKVISALSIIMVLYSLLCVFFLDRMYSLNGVPTGCLNKSGRGFFLIKLFIVEVREKSFTLCSTLNIFKKIFVKCLPLINVNSKRCIST